MDKEETITITLSIKELTILLDTLHFSHQAAVVLSNEEVKKDNKAAAKKMSAIATNSSTLYNIFYDNLDIGEPLTDTLM